MYNYETGFGQPEPNWTDKTNMEVYPSLGYSFVTDKFKNLLLLSGFVYMIDAIFRVIIVFGLKKKSIWHQITGVLGTIIISTFCITALLVVTPVYRFNAAGS